MKFISEIFGSAYGTHKTCVHAVIYKTCILTYIDSLVVKYFDIALIYIPTSMCVTVVKAVLRLWKMGRRL